MATEKFEKNKEAESNKSSSIQPDKETLNTTDPQEHMEGPLSSLMHNAGDTFDKEKQDDTEKE